MKRALFLSTLLTVTLAATGACAQQGNAAPNAPPAAAPRGGGLPGVTPIEKITDGVYKIFGGGGNTLVIVQQDGVVLVDTKMPGNGPAILSELRKVTDKPVKTIISTHSHPDHIGSTDFLREQFPDARIIMEKGAEAELAQSNPALRPTEYYDGRMTIGSRRDRIELYHTGTGHTGGDTFVFVPSAKLLFMGDVMAWNMAPFLPAGGAEAITLETEKLVEALKDKDIKYVVEGHGHVNDWDGLKRLARFNRALLTAARAAYDRGDPPGVAVDELKANPDFAVLLDDHIKKGLEYGNTPLARAHMNANIAYAEFAGEPVGFPVANGAPLPATDKHQGSDPRDTAPPTPEMLANAVAK